VGPSGNHSPSKPQQNREDKGAERSSSSQPPQARAQKDKEKDPPPEQPPAQLTLEQAAQRVNERIDFLVAYAEEHGANLNDLLKTDELLKKLEANADRLKLRAPSPEGDDLSFFSFLFFFFFSR